MTLVRAASDAAAQLVQLREAHALGVLDDHERRVRHVDADFDDGGRDQQPDLAVLERAHAALLLLRRHAAVHEADAHLRQRLGQRGRGFLGGLVTQLFGFFDERAHPVRLPSLRALLVDALDDLVAARLRQHHGLHRRAARRQLVDHGDVEIGVRGHRQRARDRRRRHDQLMRQRPPRAPFSRSGSR